MKGKINMAAEDNNLNKDFKFYVQKLVVFGKHKRSLHDLVLIYTFFAVIFLIQISSLINRLIGLEGPIFIFDIIVTAFFVIVYLVANYLKDLKYLRIGFVIGALLAINALWFLTEGSSGPSLFLIAAFVTLQVFISVGKEFIYVFILTIVNVLFLFIAEYFYYNSIVAYTDVKIRQLDTLSVVLLLFALEIPILIYARKILYKERDDAMETAEQKAEVLANMSHEIRTPMNAIIGFTELLSDPQIEKHECHTYLQIVNQNSRTLMNLLNNVINMEKINSGSTKVYYSNCDINRFLDYVVETLKTLQNNPSVKVKAVYSDNDNLVIKTDENLLFQIMVNIGYNAVKFTHQGSINLGVEDHLNHVVLYVKDTGSGISKEQQSVIFDRFQQAENNIAIKANKCNGAGLGLSISKGLTGLLKGKIWFTSKENEGTTFYVKIPKLITR